MTLNLFQEWLSSYNHRLLHENRRILLFVDNSSTHNITNSSDLKNVELIFLSPNTTSLLQPLDQGIIQNFKLKYRKLLVKRVLCELDEDNSDECIRLAKKISVYDSIQMIDSAWKSVSQNTIGNCFRKAGFPASSTIAEPHYDDEIYSLALNLSKALKTPIHHDEFTEIDRDLKTELDTLRDEDSLSFSERSNSDDADIGQLNEIIIMNQPTELVDANDIEPACSYVEASECINKLSQFGKLHPNKLPIDFCQKLEEIRVQIAQVKGSSYYQSSILSYFTH